MSTAGRMGKIGRMGERALMGLRVRGMLTVLLVACLTYIVSTVPGVRSTPGYSRLWEVGVYNLVGLGAAAAVLARTATVRADRLAWTLVGLGLASYSLGTIHFSLYLQPLAEMPYPSLSDGLWLAFYPGALAGVFLLARRDVRRRLPLGPRPATALDGLIAGLTLAAASAAFVFDRLTAGASGTAIAILTNFAYPVADLLLLLLVVSVLVVLGRSAGRAWWLLATGLVAFGCADTWFLLQVAADTYAPGSPVDATWALAQTLLAFAAWQQPVEAGTPRRSGMTTVLLPAGAGAAAVTVLVAGQFTAVSTLGVVLAAAGLVAFFLRTAQALRQAMSLAESRLQARTDELTGLPNRRAFYELVDQAIAHAAEPDAPTRAVLLLDLDRFKEVNDSLGHHTGDDLLRLVALRLADAVGAQHTVTRLGGDEFAVLVAGSARVAKPLAESVLAAIREPFDVGLMTLHIDGSIGIAELDAGAEPGRTLARADVAMYQAKAEHAGIKVYDDDDKDSEGWDRLAMVESLRRGIHSGELELDYQPVLDIRTGRPRGLEALVRWRHPSRGRIAPDEFLPLAEQTGLMHDVTGVVLELALDHAVALRDGGAAVPVSVNLSASDLLDSTLADRVLSALATRGLGADAVSIEITETLLVGANEQTDSVLERLRGHGIELSVDDYGTGYSSLAYLHDLPVSELKIDRIFTNRLLVDQRTAVIVRSTIGLAHDLGLRVVGEGVESEAQLAWLRDAGADAAQGWHIARPMSGPAALQWLLSQRDPVRSRQPGDVAAIVAEPTTASPS